MTGHEKDAGWCWGPYDFSARMDPDPSFDPECRACDLAMHTCSGCGADLNHGITACLKCRNRR